MPYNNNRTNNNNNNQTTRQNSNNRDTGGASYQPSNEQHDMNFYPETNNSMPVPSESYSVRPTSSNSNGYSNGPVPQKLMGPSYQQPHQQSNNRREPNKQPQNKPLENAGNHDDYYERSRGGSNNVVNGRPLKASRLTATSNNSNFSNNRHANSSRNYNNDENVNSYKNVSTL